MMKQLAISILDRNGYHENLRRVFTREKKDFSLYAHDQCCMLYDQIGFGLTAFSSLRDRFGLNTQDFDEYYAMIAQGRLPLNRGLVRSKEDQIRWAIILPSLLPDFLCLIRILPSCRTAAGDRGGHRFLSLFFFVVFNDLPCRHAGQLHAEGEAHRLKNALDLIQ